MKRALLVWLAIGGIAYGQSYPLKVDKDGDILHALLVHATNNPNGIVNFATGKLLVNGIPIGGGGGGGDNFGFTYIFSSSTTVADPGAGHFRLNNATQASATTLSISETDNDSNNLGDFFATLGNGTPLGQFLLKKVGDPTVWYLFRVDATGAGSGWDSITISHLAHSGSFTNNNPVMLTYDRWSLDYIAEDITNKDTDGTLAANSDTKYASQKATKTYADTKVPNTRTVGTTTPLAGGGALSANLTLSIANAAADGTTLGAAAFTASDFNATAGVISIDYTNGQAASGSTKGFLTSADWGTFNSKVSTTRSISTTSPLAGGGDLSTDRTLSIQNSAADGSTKGAAAFTANDFDATSGVVSIDYANGQKASVIQPGFLTETDWITFNSKLSTDIIEAKGDLIAGTAAATAVRFPVSPTNGLGLASASGETTGLIWKKFLTTSSLSPAVIPDETEDATIASASTLNLTGVGYDGALIEVTGTTDITTITIPAGESRVLRFTDVLDIGNAFTGNILAPNGSITTAAGFFCVVTGNGTNVYVDLFNTGGSTVANFDGGVIHNLDQFSVRKIGTNKINVFFQSANLDPTDDTIAIQTNGTCQIRIGDFDPNAELLIHSGSFASSGFVVLDASARTLDFGIGTVTATFPTGTYNVVPDSRTISTTSPLSGGGDLSTNRTLTIANAAADGSTKGAASFTANDFDASSGNISIDYANGQLASASDNGFLSKTDWGTFNNKVGSSRTINTTSPITGGGDLSADRTIAINNAAADGSTKGAASFTANDFDASSGNISIDYANGQTVSTSGKGFAPQAPNDATQFLDGTASWAVLPLIRLKATSVSVLTSGTPADIATITIPAGITRWRTVATATTACLSGFYLNSSSGTLAGANFSAFDTTGGGGVQMMASTAGPNTNAWTPWGSFNNNTSLSTTTSLVIRQTSNSANSGVLSFFVWIEPIF